MFNQTTSNFGITAAGSGDVTDQLDDVAGAGFISMLFDKAVLFICLVISSFSGTEAALLTMGNFSALTFSDAGISNGIS